MNSLKEGHFTGKREKERLSEMAGGSLVAKINLSFTVSGY